MKNAFIDNTQIHSNSERIGKYIQNPIEGLEMPEQRTASFNRPNSDGAFVSNQLYGARMITFTGSVSGDTPEEYLSRRSEIIQAFSIKRVDGLISPSTFKFKTMNDRELQIKGYPRQFRFDLDEMTHGTYRVDFYCPDFAIESQTEKTESIFLFSGGGFAIPLSIPLNMAFGGSTTATLSNDGNTDAFPKIKLHGPLTNPTLDNLTQGVQVSVTRTLSASTERVELDMLRGTALYFSSVSATGVPTLADVSGGPIVLEPGDNEIKLTNASYNDEAFTTLVWRDAYIGA